MSKIVKIDYIKLNIVNLDEDTTLTFSNDEIKMKYKGITIAILNNDDIADCKYISIKMDRGSSEMMPIRHPFNPVIEKMWHFRFFQKHRAKSIDDYTAMVEAIRLSDNAFRMSYYQIIEESYSICVKLDTKFNIMMPVAFYIDLAKGTPINKLDRDLEALFGKYTPVGKEVLY